MTNKSKQFSCQKCQSCQILSPNLRLFLYFIYQVWKILLVIGFCIQLEQNTADFVCSNFQNGWRKRRPHVVIRKMDLSYMQSMSLPYISKHSSQSNMDNWLFTWPDPSEPPRTVCGAECSVDRASPSYSRSWYKMPMKTTHSTTSQIFHVTSNSSHWVQFHRPIVTKLL